MPRVRSGDLTIVIIACSAVAVLTAVGATGTAPSGSAIGGSSFSTSPDGSKAAFLTMKELGYHVERSYEPLTAVTTDPARSVIIFASPVQMPSSMDRQALEKFIAAGGYVLATGGGGAAFLGAKKSTAIPDTGDAPRVYTAIAPSALTADAPSITMTPEVTDAAFDAAYEPVYRAGTDVVVRRAAIGSGRAVWWAGSTPLTNRAIANEGNLALLLNSVGEPPRTVLWDEHYHGHTRSLWSYIEATPLPWAGAQLALMALAAMLVFSRRHGPVRAAVEDPRTSPMEFVETMGGLYEQAGAGVAAVNAARHRLRRVLVAACGLSPDTDDDRLAVAAASRVSVDPGELTALLETTRAAEREDALPLVQRLQAMTARVSVRLGR